MYDLDFIEKEDFKKHIRETVEKYSDASQITIKEFNSNIVDAVKLTFDANVLHGGSYEKAIEAEINRQSDKTNSNHIGYFHQNIFKYFKNNKWKVLEDGFDIINEEEKIYVEMKNKWNTMNSSSSNDLLRKMKEKRESDPESSCYLVEIITKSQNSVWSKNGNQDDKIRRLSIDQFYKVVTGDEFAFYKLVKQLRPLLKEVVEEINAEKATEEVENNIVKELKEDFDSLYDGLNSLTFSGYLGFELDKDK